MSLEDLPIESPPPQPPVSTPDSRNPGHVDAIKTVIEVAGEDVRQVYIKVTGALGLAALFVTQLPFDDLRKMPEWGRWMLMAALATAGLSALLHFWYLTRLHLARLKMAEYLRTGDAKATKDLWSGDGTFWEEHRWLSLWGGVLFTVSVGAFGVVLGVLLHLY